VAGRAREHLREASEPDLLVDQTRVPIVDRDTGSRNGGHDVPGRVVSVLHDESRRNLACADGHDPRYVSPLRERRSRKRAEPLGSTEQAASLGDRRWRELLEQHHTMVRRELNRFRGREVDTAGDGFMAAFDGPARAIRCAVAIIKAVRPLGLEIRAGIHTGECEQIGEKLGGIAVHIAARVATAAPPGGVLVSQTVKDLVAGSGIPFEDQGTHQLKGVPDPWRLFAATR